MFKEDQAANDWCIKNPDAYTVSVEFQRKMAQLGIAWHNVFSNECTIDFECCSPLDHSKYHTHIRSTVGTTLNE